MVRERPDFRLVIRERTARYETVWRDEPQTDRTIDLSATEPTRIAFNAGFGRWRVEGEAEPTAWNGLARVTVQVFDHRGGDGAPAVYSLVQLVRLSPVGSDSAGEQSVKGPQSKPKAPAPRGKGGKP